MPDPGKTMPCPGCDGAMNHHADKLVTALGPDQAAHVDPSLDGVVMETHCCAACGESAARLGAVEP